MCARARVGVRTPGCVRAYYVRIRVCIRTRLWILRDCADVCVAVANNCPSSQAPCWQPLLLIPGEALHLHQPQQPSARSTDHRHWHQRPLSHVAAHHCHSLWSCCRHHRCRGPCRCYQSVSQPCPVSTDSTMIWEFFSDTQSLEHLLPHSRIEASVCCLCAFLVRTITLLQISLEACSKMGLKIVFWFSFPASLQAYLAWWVDRFHKINMDHIIYT